MLPENIRDKNGKRPDDPDYDPSSVYIDKEVFSKMPAGM